ncbi:hypothetical protein MAR_025673, partial [Mya arenaria]
MAAFCLGMNNGIMGEDQLETVNIFEYVASFPYKKMTSQQALKGKRLLVALLWQLYKFAQLPNSAYFKIFAQKVCLFFCTTVKYGERKGSLILELSKTTPVNDTCVCHRKITTWLFLEIVDDSPYTYMRLKTLHDSGQNNWASRVKSILNHLGYGHVLIEQKVYNKNSFIAAVVQRLKDLYMQEWIALTDVESEYHFLIKCPVYSDLRK